MRISLLLMALAWSWQEPAAVRDFSHASEALGATRQYRAFLPPSYAAGQKRYPAVYWLFGYDRNNEEREQRIAEWVAAHDVIVISAGPVDITGAFPLYFPELVQQADAHLRTIADRDHRGVAGASAAGFLALWTAGKFPDLVASASSIDPYAEATVGPAAFPAECGVEDGAYNYDAVRTMPLAPDAAAALAFHADAFAHPQPRPSTFSHADVYPNFSIWGWEAASNRRRPGFTVLENVSAKGFRSAVREWVPGGATFPEVKLSLVSAPLYKPGSAHPVTYIRLRDGKTRRAVARADRHGRLSFDVDGDAWEVGVSSEPLLAASGYEFDGAEWATAGRPVTLRVRFWNKGGARSGTVALKWESPNPEVRFATATGRLFALGPGESGTVPVTFTAGVAGATTVRIVAVEGGNHLPVDVPVFPASEPASLFQIADGTTVDAWQHGTEHGTASFGEGNRDNHAAPGESFALLFPDGEYLRPAEVFTNDACVDLSVRASDPVGEHASIKYSLPAIRKDCQPGHVVHALARVAVPGRPPRFLSVQFPIWYRNN